MAGFIASTRAHFKSSLLEMLVLAASIISVARVLKRGVKHLMSFLSLESTERGD